MSEHTLSAMLDELVDPCLDSRGDWADVLRRAQVVSPAVVENGRSRPRLFQSRGTTAEHRPRWGRWLTRHRIVVAVAVGMIVLLGAVVATPARGIGERIMDLVWSDSAPPEVQDLFASSKAYETLLSFNVENGHILRDRYSAVIPSETRGIIAIEAFDGRPIYLWAAPTEDGRECWLIQTAAEPATGRPYGKGSCDLPDPPWPMQPSVGWTDKRPDIKTLSARIYDESISEVVVELNGEAPAKLRVVAGYALGAVPVGARVVSFVGRDAEGNEVARMGLKG